MPCTERPRSCASSTLDPRYATSKYNLRQYAAVARRSRIQRSCSSVDPVPSNEAPVTSTWAETWQMGAEAYGLFGGAPCTPSRFQRRTRPAPSWQLRFKAATREWITFGEHTRFARRCKGSRMSAQPQGTVPGRAPSTTMSRNHAPLASS